MLALLLCLDALCLDALCSPKRKFFVTTAKYLNMIGLTITVILFSLAIFICHSSDDMQRCIIDKFEGINPYANDTLKE